MHILEGPDSPLFEGTPEKEEKTAQQPIGFEPTTFQFSAWQAINQTTMPQTLPSIFIIIKRMNSRWVFRSSLWM